MYRAGDKQIFSRLEVASAGDTRSSVVTSVYTGDGTSGNIKRGGGRDGTSAALVLVGTRRRHDSGDFTVVRVVADVRSMAIVGKTFLLDDSGVGTDGGVARVSSVVRRTDGVANGKRVGSGANDTLLNIGVVGGNSLLLADEETASGSRAFGVVVLGAGTVSLLLLVVLHENKLHDGSEKEEEGTNDGKSEDGSVQLAGGAKAGVVVVSTLGERNSIASRSVTERSSDIAGAAVGSLAGQDSNGNEATEAEDIKEQTKNAKGSNASQAASQENSAHGVQSNDTRETLNCLPSGRDVKVVVCKDGQEVREDADDAGSTAECECVKSSLQQTKGASLEDTHDDDRRGCCWEGIILKRERRLEGDRLLVVVVVEVSRLIMIFISRREGSSLICTSPKQKRFTPKLAIQVTQSPADGMEKNRRHTSRHKRDERVVAAQ
jgi:hypothetical protein